MRLRTKIFAFILLPTILFFAGTAYFVSIQVHEISEENAMDLLHVNGQNLSQQIELELETPLMSLKTISQTFEGIIVRGDIPSRDQAHVMLKELLDNNASLISTWMFWKENAFDGQDELFRNAVGHDETGKFIPIWSKSSSGQLLLNPIKSYEESDMVKENFDTIFQTGKSMMFEPYIDDVDGNGQLMTTIAVPIRVHENVVGITGVDILLKDIDEIVAQYKFYDTGFAGLVSNSGIIVSNQDKDFIGRQIFETQSLATYEGKN